jgi:antitoxin component of MazEF toxin-antitoxin module
MTKKLTRHGNSLALVIDKPILDALGVDENTPLRLAFDGRSLLITPASTPGRRKKVRAALKEICREFDGALRRLAE